jgi:hypothetical protein
VVDVTVRHGDGESLHDGYKNKIEKYNSLLPTLEQLPAEQGSILPITVGIRGATPKATIPSRNSISATRNS